MSIAKLRSGGTLLLFALAGCASEGALHPPSLHLPSAVGNLSAERFGSVVHLTWTAPTRTSDGIALAGKHSNGTFVTEICRETKSLPATDACSPITRLPIQVGATAALNDALPPQLASGEPRAIFYRVRVVNGAGKGAGWTEIATAAGEAPPPIRNLRATAVDNGVALHWDQAASASGQGTLLRVTRGAKEALLTVQADPAGRSGEDRGGALDTGATRGIEQRYRVYRSRTVVLGKAPGRVPGKLELTLNSEPAMATVPAGARPAPPPPPTGLEAVVNSLGAPEIDLVWQADPSGAATGYVLDRAEGDGAFAPLTPNPVTGFTYADKDVRPGARYRYRIASAGAAGSVGAQSAEVTATVPQP